MKKRIILAVYLLTYISVVFGQTHDLSQEELDAFRIQCQERIDAFQMGLEIIADKQQDMTIKQHYIKTLPDMFMGNGDPWTDVSGEKHPAVKMQVSVIRYNNVIDTKSPSLKEYLNSLKNLKWSSVKIKKAKTCLISNFYKRADNLYEATATFFQYFEGSNGDGVVYKDFTQKEVHIYIQRVEDGQLGTYWDLKFGDINVSEISRM